MAFSGGLASPDVVDALADAFRTGIGLTFDQLGPVSAHRGARMSGPWARLALVQHVIPALRGVEDRLRAGARVVEVGCGGGQALLAMARAYPASRFEGIDLSRLAIEDADRSAAESGLDNVTFAVGRGGELAPDAAHDLVMTLDCLHDMTRPAGGGRHPPDDPARRHLAHSGDPIDRHLVARPSQPDPGHVLRLLRRQLHVVGLVRAGRGRPGHAGPAASGDRGPVSARRLPDHRASRPRRPREPLLRGHALAAHR